MEKMAHRFFGKTPGKIRLDKTLLLLGTALLVGLFLRTYRIADYMVFLGDEGRDMLVVYNILHGNLTLLGPTASVGGFFLGPIYYYMITPFLWLFNYNPIGPSVMVALFGVATIALVYKVGKDMLNREAGIIAAVLYAVSPIVVSFSRSSWNPNVMPFFTLLTLYSLYRSIVRNSIKGLFVTGFLFGILMQLHYLATFVGVIIFLYLLASSIYLKRMREFIKYCFVMLAGFLLGFAPFLLFELRHEFTNTQNVIKFVFESGETGAGEQFFTTLKSVFNRVFGGLLLNYPASNHYSLYELTVLKLWGVGFSLVAFLSMGYLGLKTFKEKENFLKYLLFILWGVIGIGLFGLYKKPIYDYYLGFMFPLPFLMAGFLFSSFLRKPIGKILVAVLVGLMIGLSLYFSHLRTEPNRLVNQSKTISDFVLSKTEGRPYNFALLSKSNSDSAYRYFFKLEGKDPVAILPPQVDPDRKSVTDQLFVICENLPCAPLGNPLWEIAGFGQAQLAGEWDVSVVKVYRLVSDKKER